jgi:hypothetical protein
VTSRGPKARALVSATVSAPSTRSLARSGTASSARIPEACTALRNGSGMSIRGSCSTSAEDHGAPSAMARPVTPAPGGSRRPHSPRPNASPPASATTWTCPPPSSTESAHMSTGSSARTRPTICPWAFSDSLTAPIASLP